MPSNWDANAHWTETANMLESNIFDACAGPGGSMDRYTSSSNRFLFLVESDQETRDETIKDPIIKKKEELDEV